MVKEFQKELEVEIRIDGSPLQGTSTIFVKDGKVDYSLAEEHFYEIMRKWEKDWLKEAMEEEREQIVRELTKEEEEKLQVYFQKNDGWNCNKDNIEDYFESWLEDLDLDDLKKIIN